MTIPESTGVVAAIAPDDSSLLGLVSIIAPVIAGGNSIVILASESFPLCSISFAEVLQTSDVPGGVVNILTGYRKELLEHFSSHMDVNAIIYCGENTDDQKLVETNAALNVKHVILFPNQDSIAIQCYNYSVESGDQNHLRIGINTKEYRIFLSTKAYN